MSFSEMMESGRGPGVIGMLMALLVLIGFSALYTFVFDERLQGGGQSIEHVIATQTAEIVNLKGVIDNSRQRLGGTAGLLAIGNKLAEVKKENRFREAKLDSLKQGIVKTTADLAAVAAKFEDYKNAYRKFARNKAKGENIGRLTTRKGTIYENVVIKEVTAIGIQINHMDGMKRVPFGELPEELQDRFQFDSNQRDAEISKENAVRKEHESAVAVVDAEGRQQAEEEKQRNAVAARRNADHAIAAKQDRIRRLRDEIMSIERALPMEAMKRLSRAPIMREQINGKNSEINALEGQIRRLQATP